MNICIIGAGWFGCHIACKLIEDGHKVKIFEKESAIFFNASGNNQNRLHLGFHYPRSKKTQVFSKKGFLKFKKEYGFLTKKFDNNIYSISKSKNTKMNFDRYLRVFKNLNLKFKKIDNKNDFLKKFKNLEGSISCDEELILVSKSINYFKNKLKSNIIYNFEVTNFNKNKNKFIIKNETFDYLINCTGLRLQSSDVKNLIYEYCVIFLYKKKKLMSDFALTIMDGPFFTLYPWNENNEYGLYSVKDSRLLKNENIKNLEKNVLKKINKKRLNKTRVNIENKFANYYPSFKAEFNFKKYLLSYRTIIKNEYDTRVCKIFQKKNEITVFPGKIDHIFYAYDKIKKCLKKS